MFQLPDSEDDWNRVAQDFHTLWHFPNCIGAVDGKLVHIQRPVRCGSTYFNYKRTFSINMMAVADARYQFLYVTVGAQGAANDASVFYESNFSTLIAEPSNPLSIPDARIIPGTDVQMPMVFVADEAYPLRPYLMKPFSSRGLTASERIFNYRLSRARRVIENAFGILVNRFRILRNAIQLQPEKVSHVVLAACALHNFLRQKSLVQDAEDNDDLLCDDNDELLPAVTVTHQARTKGVHYNAQAKQVRDQLATYFVKHGQVPWQWKHANLK